MEVVKKAGHDSYEVGLLDLGMTESGGRGMEKYKC